MNRVVRGITLSKDFRVKDMKRLMTMEDLRRQCGIDTVETAIGKRKLGYLGHLARYPEDRAERQSINRCYEKATLTTIC